jgi:acetyl esterase/lipase
MKKCKLLAAALCAGMLVTSLNISSAAAETEEEVSLASFADIAYMDDESTAHLLNIYGEAEDGETKPVIIRIHGGGFFGGTQANQEDYSQYLADQGFIVVAINYTLMPAAGSFQNIEQDVFAALEWVEEHAEEYHLDLDNVLMTGDSAGGYLVNLTATIISEESLQEKFGLTPPSYEIKGYVLTCPEIDILELREDLTTGSGFKNFMANQITEEILMDDALEEVDLYSIINPETYPEMYLITTPQDAILYDQAVDFDAWLTENNIAHEFHVYEQQENELLHVFNVSNIDWVESIQANEDSVAYMKSLIE